MPILGPMLVPQVFWRFLSAYSLGTSPSAVASLVPKMDLRLLSMLYGGTEGTWGPVMLGFTLLGSGWSTIAVVPVVWRAQTRPFGRALLAAITAQATLVWLTKRAVGRVRPWIALHLAPPLGSPHDPSFPSGHAAGSFCVVAFLALALPAIWPERRSLRGAVVAASAFGAAFVGLSRVYLGAHFPSDVVGGAILGSLVGAVAALQYRAGVGRKTDRTA